MRFIPTETATEGVWMIGEDNLDWVQGSNACGCSFHVMGARLLHMTYPDYLKYLRANGAELRGRTGYVYPVFKDKDVCQSFCTQLNKEWAKVKKYIEVRGE